jgi:hydroxymethylbilane synthase
VTTVRIATRGSDLALVQARYVAARIESELGASTEIVLVKTTGDRIQSVSLAKIGGKGLFVKEIEEALTDGRADLAVHSAKDLPAVLAEGLALAAFPERADCRDALVARTAGATLSALSNAARVGTGSARRAAQLKANRADLEIVPLRGNVPTRLRKLVEQELDAVILACAGLDRLGFGDQIEERISPDLMLPAVAQGALALEARSGEALCDDLAALNDARAARSVSAERGFLARLGADCTVPVACLAEDAADGTLWLRGLVAAVDGSRIVRGELEVAAGEAAAGGSRLAERILASGGEAILAEIRSEVGS